MTKTKGKAKENNVKKLVKKTGKKSKNNVSTTDSESDVDMNFEGSDEN